MGTWFGSISRDKYEHMHLVVPMATLVWKARKEMCTLGLIFEKNPSVNLRQPVPGHSELAPNKLAQILNTLILFYKQHMIKKTSWTFLDFIQSLLIFVA